MKQKDLRQRDLPFDASPAEAAIVESAAVAESASFGSAAAALGSPAAESAVLGSVAVEPVVLATAIAPTVESATAESTVFGFTVVEPAVFDSTAVADSVEAATAPAVESAAFGSDVVGPTFFESAAIAPSVTPMTEPPRQVPDLRSPGSELRSPVPGAGPGPVRELRVLVPRHVLAPLWTRVRAEWVLLAAAILLLGIGIGRVPLLDPDEARYASASRSMLERGDLVVPYYNGVERLNKPALFYWLQAAAFRLLGPTAAAARLPSVVAALLVLLVVYLFAKAEFGRDVAVRACFILLTCPLFVLVGKTGITDMTLCLFVVLALGLWYRSHVGRGSRRLGWVGVSICLGLAFLVKGPVGIAVPCLVIAVFLAIRRDWNGFRPKVILSGAFVALAVFLPWVALLVYRLGSETSAIGPADVLLKGTARVGELLRRETIDRTINGLDHPQPFFYYVVASLVAFFPWWCYLPFAAGRSVVAGIRHRGVRGVVPPVEGDRDVFPPVDRDSAVLFLVTWMLTVLVFFSMVRGKLVTYILPAAPPLALLVGREWVRLRAAASGAWQGRGYAPEAGARQGSGHSPVFGSGEGSGPESRSWSVARSRPMTRWAPGGSALLGVFVIVLLAYAVVTPPAWLRGFELMGAGLGVAFLVVASAPALARRPQAALISLAGLMTLMLAVVPVVAEHEIGTYRSLRDLALEAGIADRPWSRVIAYKISRPSLVFYGHRDVTVIETPAALRSVLDPESLVVIDRRRFDELGTDWQNAFRIVAVQGSVLAVAPIAPLPSGDPPLPRRAEGSRGKERGTQQGKQHARQQDRGQTAPP